MKLLSAAGLTTAVELISSTGRFALEYGVLVLANGEIAGLNKFDKLELKDQVAIYRIEYTHDPTNSKRDPAKVRLIA